MTNSNQLSPRVLLFWPVFHSVLPAAFQNFLRVVASAVHHLPGYLFDPMVVSRSSVHAAMNTAVEVVLLNGHDYLIAFDDDCLPEIVDFPIGDPRRYQVIPRMLALCGPDKPILSGVGYMRGYPHTTTVGRLYEEGMALVLGKTDEDENIVKGFHWIDDIERHHDELDENGLLKVDFCGVPVICIHRSVLERIKKPLFETRDDVGGQSTHDIHFCTKARDAGFPIYVDTHIDCGHIIEAPIINRSNKAKMVATLQAAARETEAVHG